MSTNACQTTSGPCDASLGVDPFVSNRYHFGMLLGVADLEAEQAYHRGKSWLHNAWLHGAGVVWGLPVSVDADRNELVVGPGLAIDEHGRELSVVAPMCVDLGLWFAAQDPDSIEVDEHDDGSLHFLAHVELCHDTCLDRPVPSISEPCEGSTYDTAYSRAIERGRPRIVAGPIPPPSDPAYPRLRQFFGQIPTTAPMVIEARAAIELAAPADRPATCVQWFRRIAAADVTDLGPEPDASSWSPSGGDGCIPLAALRVHLRRVGDRIRVIGDGDDPTDVDQFVRPSHVRTRTVQELLCHGHGAAPLGPPEDDGPDLPDDPLDGGGPDAPDPDPDPDDEGGGGGDPPFEPRTDERPRRGPQADPTAVTLDGSELRLRFTRPIDARTVKTEAFRVSSLRADGWAPLEVRRVRIGDDARHVTVDLKGAPRARPVRIVVDGAGATPLIGTGGRPLDGVAGTGPGDPTGRDASLMITDNEDDPR